MSRLLVVRSGEICGETKVAFAKATANRRGVFFMVYVKKMPGQSDDQLIRNFSKKVMDAGIIQEIKRRQFYLKPSLAKKLRKKLKQEEAARMRSFSS